jgi:hypothetical protein
VTGTPDPRPTTVRTAARTPRRSDPDMTARSPPAHRTAAAANNGHPVIRPAARLPYG